MSGKAGRSGRRRAVSTLIKEALDDNEGKLHIQLGKLEAIALDKTASARDRVEAIFYLIDRAVGTAKSTTDLRLGKVITITAEQWAEDLELLERPGLEEQKLIKQYKAEENTNKTPLLVS